MDYCPSRSRGDGHSSRVIIIITIIIMTKVRVGATFVG
jgi:hypothetical protein